MRGSRIPLGIVLFLIFCNPVLASRPTSAFLDILRLRGYPLNDLGLNQEPTSIHPGPQPKTTASFSSSEPGWETPFYARGPAGPVFSLGFLGGKVLVAGDFHGADDVPAPGLAEWNGTRWSTPGGGADHSYQGSHVGDIFVDGGRVYAVPAPASIGGIACRGAAYWDGQAWTCLSKDFESEITVIGAWRGTPLISTAAGVFRWGGTAWLPFTDIKGTLTRFEGRSDGLWMSGKFTIDGDTAIRNLARWNGSSWKGCGNASTSIRDFASLGNQVFAIENYRRSRLPDSQAVVRWTGTAWVRADSGISLATAATIESDSQDVFLVAGEITDSLSLWKWGGGRFARVVGSGFAGYPVGMRIDSGKAYLGGLFRAGSSPAADNVMKWEGEKWRGLTTLTTSGPFYASTTLRANGKSLFVAGGGIFAAGDKPARGITRWDGSDWDPLGGGLRTVGLTATLKVRDIAFRGDDVYVAGLFESAPGPARNISLWDGKVWRTLGAGFPGEINTLAPFGTGIVAGGGGDSAAIADPALKHQIVGLWDGSGWNGMGSSIRGRIDKLAVYRGALLAFGNLKGDSDTGWSAIKAWVGTKWSPVPDPDRILSGVDSIVDATLFADTLFFIGYGHERREFRLYSWNGAAFSRRLALLRGDALAADDKHLFLAGTWPSTNALNEATLARYDGSAWHAMLSYREIGLVPALAVCGEYLYATGRPGLVNSKPAYLMFRWNRAGISRILTRGRARGGSRNGLNGMGDMEIFSLDGRKIGSPAPTNALRVSRPKP